MSQHNKLNLWYKIKRLLAMAVPQQAIDRLKTAKNTHSEPAPTDITDDLKTSTKVNVSINNHGTDAKTTENKATQEKNATDSDFQNEAFFEGNSFEDNYFQSNFQSEASQDSHLQDSHSQDKALQDDDPMAITNYIKQYLEGKQWHYTYYRPKSSDSQQSHHLSLRMKNKHIDCGYLFRIQENNGLMAIYGILPFLIPESHQSAAMLLITQINYDMLIGNLEMDVYDGEIRYKNAIDVEAVGMDDETIEHMLQSVIAMTTVAYELFSDLINHQNPAEDMSTLLDELRQQADARTFFLPSHYVQ